MSIYRKAAERIASGESIFACIAINDLSESGNLYSPEELSFAKYFKPEDSGNIWFGYWLDKENQLARSLALLFMAEIESEQKCTKE